MEEINKPQKRTFWKILNPDGSILHSGITEIDQVTTTGQGNITSSVNANDVFEPLPAQPGAPLVKGQVYAYNGGMIIVEQTHERTIYAPEDTPALFTVFRANNEGLQW